MKIDDRDHDSGPLDLLLLGTGNALKAFLCHANPRYKSFESLATVALPTRYLNLSVILLQDCERENMEVCNLQEVKTVHFSESKLRGAAR